MASARRFVPLLVGLAALIGITLVAANPALLDAIVEPPAPVRAALVGGSVAVGVVLLLRAFDRLAGEDGLAGAGRDLPGMIRAVRLMFLALAAFAAAAGWALAHPLPLVVAVIIAGVDVLETSFLLLAVTVRDRGSSR